MTTTTTHRPTASTVHEFRVGDRVRIRHVPTTPGQDAGHVGVVIHIAARRILPVTVRVGHHRDQYDPAELEPAAEFDALGAFPAAATAPAAGKATNQHRDQAPTSPATEPDR